MITLLSILSLFICGTLTAMPSGSRTVTFAYHSDDLATQAHIQARFSEYVQGNEVSSCETSFSLKHEGTNQLQETFCSGLTWTSKDISAVKVSIIKDDSLIAMQLVEKISDRVVITYREGALAVTCTP